MRNLRMCQRNIYIDVPLFHTYTMKNIHFTPNQTTEQKCKSKTILNVDSNLYSEDLNYQNSIDEKIRAYELKNN